jgi:nicotinate-nucleotide adenylyltransferase
LNKVIGILGGTFDPPHWGHIRLAEHFSGTLQLDELFWLPSGEPWQKGAHITPAKDRLDMTIAAADVLKEELQAKNIDTKVMVDSMEIDRGGPSYTIDTVEALKATYPNDKIVLILGTDAHATIDQWHRSDELKKLVEVLVIDRPDFPGSPTLDIDALNISATAVRDGEFDLLPPAVVTYIKERGLYASK